MAAISETELNIQTVLQKVSSDDVGKDDVIMAYNKWAEMYEKDCLEKLGYSAHIKVSIKLCKLFKPELRSKIVILDAGAGTCLLGQEMNKNGFTNVHALEPSKDMLMLAQKKNVYTRYYCEYMTESPLNINGGMYDCLVGIGMLGDKHAPFSAMHEIIRVTKPGGYVILAVRRHLLDTYVEYENLEPKMEELESLGKWKKVSKTVFPNYYNNSDGILYTFHVM